MSNQTTIDSLIQGLQTTDPRLYDILRMLSADLGKALEDLEPLVRQASTISTPGTSTILPPSLFTYSFTTSTVRFNWSLVTGASQYEIRSGTDWDTASLVLRTSVNQADIAPLLIGSHPYLIKSIDSSGNYSVTSTSLSVVVPDLGPFSITARTIDNNILLSWTTPTSTFTIETYTLYKDGSLVGDVPGTFTVFFEPSAGSYTYRIVPRDIAGNLGVESEITVAVSAPPDYVLQDNRIDDFSGTKVEVYLEGTRLICCPVTPQTWMDHFINHGWSSIQDQINAGFPIYAQPTDSAGSYEHVIDYGTILTNVIINLAWQTNIVVANVTLVTKIATSTDNISYTSFTTGVSVFAASVRYLKVRVEFTATT